MRKAAGYDGSARPFGEDFRREASIFSWMNAAPKGLAGSRMLGDVRKAGRVLLVSSTTGGFGGEVKPAEKAFFESRA